MFNNDEIKLGDGSAGATTDLGKYFIDRNANGLKDVACLDSDNSEGGGDECYVDVWNNYAEGDLKGTYTPIGSANVALVKPQGKKAVIFSALYDFVSESNFQKSVDNSMASQMRDCAECHVGGGAMEYVPVAQGTVLDAGIRTELRTDQTTTIVGTGVNTFNYFIDQYDDNNDGNKGEVLAQNYADTGVLEMDCLICHLDGYSWDNRTAAIRKGNFDASRVAGAKLGAADNVVAGSSAGAGYGKVVTYDSLMITNSGGNATLSDLVLNKIVGTPLSANCTGCHFGLHKVDWKKRGDSWHPNMSYKYEVHGSLGCMGCHTRTDNLTMDPNNNGNPDNPLWTGNAVSGDAAATLGHDPSKGNAPYGSVWNKNDNTVRTCAGCHTDSSKSYYGFSGAPDPTDRHAQLGLTQTIVQTKGMGKMDGVANGTHLDIIMCEGCHSRKMGTGPVDGHHSAFEWGTGGAMVDGTGPDPAGRLTDHENLFIERTMYDNLGIAWSVPANKLGPRNALVSMFWLDKDDTGVDINADGQPGSLDAVNSMHVRNAMDAAGLQALTADGTMFEADIVAQKAALKSYLTSINIGTSDKLKLSLMGVFFKSSHGTTPAQNAWGAGGCKDCHGKDKGFYNGPYDLKPRDLQASWSNKGAIDWSAVEGGKPGWKYVVPFTAVNNDNYTGRNLAVPICSSYYGPNARPAAPETPAQAAERLELSTIPVTGDACASPAGTAGTWTVYTLGQIKADQQFTDFHPTVWAKGQVGRSIAITAAMGEANTIRTMDRSEGLWEENFVTGTYNGAIKGTDGKTYTTRAAWVNYLNGLGGRVHGDHLTMACSDCHYNGTSNTNVQAELMANYGVASDTVARDSGSTTEGDGAVKLFTFTIRPGSGTATCATACHDVALVGAAPQVAKARISTQTLLDANFKVKLDGSNSACYAVDLITGQITKGTNSYDWTIAGGASTDPVNCDGSAACVATWPAADDYAVSLKVTCSAGGTDTSAIEVTAEDVGKGVNADPGLAAVVTGQTVNIKPASLDSKVGDVQILWGDYTKSTITTTTTFKIANFTADGIDHTYGKTYVGGKTYDVSVTTVNTTGNKNKYTYDLKVYIAP